MYVLLQMHLEKTSDRNENNQNSVIATSSLNNKTRILRVRSSERFRQTQHELQG